MTQEQIMPVLAGKNEKPLDFGIGRLSASVMPNGRICSVNGSHSEHGFITLTHIEQMPDGKWYDTEFVRAYRERIATADSGFGIFTSATKANTYLVPDPLFSYQSTQGEVISAYNSQTIDGEDVCIQRLLLINNGTTQMNFPISIGGRLNLTRCSYGQLTERGPIPIPAAQNILSVTDNRITICNNNLGARADLLVFDGEKPLLLPNKQVTQADPIDLLHKVDLVVAPGEARELTLLIAMGEGQHTRLTGGVIHQLHLPEIPSSKQLTSQKTDWTKLVVKRNLDYVLSCCAIPVSTESVCIITDHQLLPLSWNRDAYYQLELLKACYEESTTSLKQQIQSVLKGHLLWMYEDAQRPEDYWGRAYLVNGVSKDQVFQLDQQCYPLLELCEYYEQFGDVDTVRRCLPTLKAILLMLEDYRDKDHYLYETGETPADDDVIYPYHFSSQVLVWHTFKHLDSLNQRFHFSEQDFSELAQRVRRDCLKAFSTERNGQPMFAYLTDLKGQYQFYHDANDLPTVYAPLWGFCDKTDPYWLGTMAFSFTNENEGGYYSGAYEGLGSVHTPHKWPLGDGQELLYAWISGDIERKQRVLEKLKETACWDGMYNEAVDENTGKIVSRYWFSWPGAFIACGLKLVATLR